MHKGDRCVLLAANSIDWVALDLAAMAEGIIVVPLYARQAPAELAAMMRDAQPQIDLLRRRRAARGRARGVALDWRRGITNRADRDSPVQTFLASSAGDGRPDTVRGPAAVRFATTPIPWHIIYTSGTSGEAKGVLIRRQRDAHALLHDRAARSA